ncbi:hypothetical protein BB934_28340 (plasmid) [Microvirga ossetica]|uniref:YHYH domain-containing protein n=1 Tax=Microvirga ossetica TaxID=1882682 RepID=A0A1B2EQJ0_9HYPH|nr:hypothetical protein BB934_28340 [Microvirga ossetica]
MFSMWPGLLSLAPGAVAADQDIAACDQQERQPGSGNRARNPFIATASTTAASAAAYGASTASTAAAMACLMMGQSGHGCRCRHKQCG